MASVWFRVFSDGSTAIWDEFDIRKQNKQTIDSITARGTDKIHWKGVFRRLPGSATRSKFADRRNYTYKGKTIDHQVHLGEDLASNARSPIPAANSGKIVFADVGNDQFLGFELLQGCIQLCQIFPG